MDENKTFKLFRLVVFVLVCLLKRLQFKIFYITFVLPHKNSLVLCQYPPERKK